MDTARLNLRTPAVAGRFYDSDPARCEREARRHCRPYAAADLPDTLHGAVVPHAGWVYSGRVAGGTLATLVRRSSARVFVLTGTVHHFTLAGPVVDAADAWETPIGSVPIDAELRTAIARLDGFAAYDEAHRPEHSLEVQLPFLRIVADEALRIVPCLVPTLPDAPKWGEALGQLLLEWPEPVAVIASSDLTHYGPRFGFTPHGADEDGCRWASETNDRALLDLVERMAVDEIVPHATRNRSACGGGAIAMTLAASRALGAARGVVLEQTDSNREMDAAGDANALDTVGYAGVVF